MIDTTPLIDRMVTQLRARGVIQTTAVESAMRRVPRHRLVETFYLEQPSTEAGETVTGPRPMMRIVNDRRDPAPEHLDVLYADRAVHTRLKDGLPTSSISQPTVVASMLEHLELATGLAVLEIGAGSGYNAALIAEIVGAQSRVVSVDIDAELVDQTRRLLSEAGYSGIRLITRDGFEGAPEAAPFDRIVATVGCPDLSPRWAEQLDPGGFMLIPLQMGVFAPLVRVRPEAGALHGQVIAPAGFLGMQGTMAKRDPYSGCGDRFGVPAMDGARRLPLFDELTAGHGEQVRIAAASGFHSFLALRDKRTFATGRPSGFGLFEADVGSVLVSLAEEAVLIAGDDRLYEELRGRHAEWRGLGRPAITDYRIEFQPLSEEGRLAPEHGWTVDRSFYRWILTAATAT